MPIEHAPNPHNERYLAAKRDRMGHTIHHQALPLDEEMFAEEHRRDDGSERYAIVVARFYEELAERLVEGAGAR